MTAKIGIMGALDEEIGHYREKLSAERRMRIAGFDFHLGRIGRRDVVVVKSGIGKVNASVCAQILIDRFGISALIFTGVAGALNPKLSVADVVVSRDSCQHDIDASAIGHERGKVPFSKEKYFKADVNLVRLALEAAKSAKMQAIEGRMLTGDQFLSDAKKGAELRMEMGGDCIDMESAAVAHTCALNGIPHVIIRSISDKADHSAPSDFATLCATAAKNSSMLVEMMVLAMVDDPGVGALKKKIRTVPHWPKKGVMFRDITTLLKDKEGFRETISEFVRKYEGEKIDIVAGIESRGFIIGAALADRLGVGFVPIRKKGKLPGKTAAETYDLEYGTDTIEIHEDAVSPGKRVLLVDDLVATGGTAIAASRLIRKLGGNIVECAFMVDLPALGGRKKLEAEGNRVFALMEFEGE